MTARVRLRRSDGTTYLNRWGLEWNRIGGVFVHRMDAPDPGKDLHDHPWWFASMILRGGYVERRAMGRTPERYRSGPRRWLSWRTLRLDECHRITRLHRSPTWTLVVHGPRRRDWGFYTVDGWMDAETYANSGRRDLVPERGGYS